MRNIVFGSIISAQVLGRRLGVSDLQMANRTFPEFKPFARDTVILYLACFLPFPVATGRALDERVGPKIPDCLHGYKCSLQAILSGAAWRLYP
jgi:hypothetical protein